MNNGRKSKRELIFEYKGTRYPSYIKSGDAASYVIPFAKEFCKGEGLDIGGFFEWTFPGAMPIKAGAESEFREKFPQLEFILIKTIKPYNINIWNVRQRITTIR